MSNTRATTPSAERIRSDLEFGQMAADATAGLAAANQRWSGSSSKSPRNAPVRKTQPSLILVAVWVAALVFAGATLIQRTQAGPGVALDASRFVRAGTASPASGSFLVTAVSRRVSDGPMASDGVQAMRTAQKNAITAATQCLGHKEASALTISVEDMTGASAGLIFALSAIDALDQDRLATDRQIAGTGTIREDGSVGDVRHVGLKAQAAEGAGADLFFVPAGQIDAARRTTTTLRIVGVRTLDDAVRILTGSGCRSR